jgi:hypothetical protein
LSAIGNEIKKAPMQVAVHAEYPANVRLTISRAANR